MIVTPFLALRSIRPHFDSLTITSAPGLRMTDGQRTSKYGQPDEAYLRDLAVFARDRARELTTTTLRLLDDSATIGTNSRVRAARAVRVRDELRQTMKAHAEMMRAVGEPPERVIIEAEAIIDRAVADLQHESTESRRRAPEDAELRGDLVRWTIDAYFSDCLRAPEERQ
jgi:hypothetical protein